jgi:hypothetical protein
MIAPFFRPFILSDIHKVFDEKSADSNRLFLIEYDVSYGFYADSIF